MLNNAKLGYCYHYREGNKMNRSPITKRPKGKEGKVPKTSGKTDKKTLMQSREDKMQQGVEKRREKREE